MSARIRVRGLLLCRLVLLAAFQFVLPGTSRSQSAAGDVDWSLTLLTRFESRQNYNFAGSSQDYLLTRAQFDLSWQRNEQSRVFIELRDSRVADENDAEFPSIPDSTDGTVFVDQLDLHQAYWERSFESGLLRAGRQKLNLGDRRMVGSGIWLNNARFSDGIRLILDDVRGRQFNLFATKYVAVDPDGINDHRRIGNRYRDSDFHGIYVTDPKSVAAAELHYWYYYRSNRQFNDETSTVGLRYIRSGSAWRPDIQFALQDGQFGGQEHSAWMLSANLKRSFGTDELGFAYNFASGDSSASDNRHETFDNLFGLNHAYYGSMDLFSLQNIHNFEVSYRREIREGLSVRIALNDFRLAESTDAWYNAGLAVVRIAPGGAASHVGTEADVVVQGRILDGRMNVDAGLSVLSGGSYLDTFGASGSARFLYIGFSYAVGSN